MPFRNKKYFTQRLIDWYRQSHRPLPWKGIRDPYLIWLSEIILQQTRAEQGRPYYEKFKQAYPTVFDMAGAPEDEIMKLWQGLGYYSRARNMHFTAQFIANEREGKFPETVKELQALKGVGPYTAAAIASFAFNKPAAVVDGNVYRVLSRFFGIEKAVDDNDARKFFGSLAQELILKQDPATYNQAIMDLGAIVCTPRNYKCDECFLKEKCSAFAKGNIDNLPVKNKKIKRRTRYFNYFIIQDEQGILINKRTSKDIWKNLYEFPLFESKIPINNAVALNEGLAEIGIDISGNSTEFKLIHSNQQQLTHQKIMGSFWEIRASEPYQIRNGFIWVDAENLSNFAFPRILSLFLEDNFLNLGE
ncbi:MAG: A/G-specific adenine glycosylase [Bacteroidetes bacterium]|nr:MAG: A/G-specific adenine glycosylase [Bacteroidota bacterium]